MSRGIKACTGSSIELPHHRDSRVLSKDAFATSKEALLALGDDE
jgi:hypothetical protein